MKEIFCNNLIFSTILDHLDVTNIKNLRLVCKTWFANATKILSSKTRLNILNISNDPTTPTFKVDPNLLRNIKICFLTSSFLSDWDNHKKLTIIDGMRLISFLYENHTFVKHLDFESDGTLAFFTILNIFKFPTLQQISINILTRNINSAQGDIAIPPQAVTTFETRPRLSHINIHHESYAIILDESRLGAAEIDPGFKLVLQNLIDSAPNLNSFTFTSFKFCPDLSQCKNIKKATLTISTTITTDPTLNVDEFNATMSQMASTLQELTLTCPTRRRRRADNTILETDLMCLPCFPKLEKLTLDQPWTFINPTRFPALESLCMKALGEAMLDKCISSLAHVMNTVKTFAMINQGVSQYKSDPEAEYGFLLPEKVKPLFPNAVEIIYKQKQTSIQTCFKTYTNYLQSLLKMCNQRKIGQLYAIVLEKVPLGYHQLAELKYRKDAIEWRCQELDWDHSETEVLLKHAEILMEILLTTKKTIKSVVVYNMFLGIKDNQEVLTRIKTFIKEHGLPVHFR